MSEAVMQEVAPVQAEPTTQPIKKRRTTPRELREQLVETSHDLANALAEVKDLRAGYDGLRDLLDTIQDSNDRHRARAEYYETATNQHEETIKDLRHVAAGFASLVAGHYPPAKVLTAYVHAVNQLTPMPAPSQALVDEAKAALAQAYAAEVNKVDIRAGNQSTNPSDDLIGLLESLGARGISVADVLGGDY